MVRSMTTVADTSKIDALVQEAKVHAALSGIFDPAALPVLEGADADTAIAVASALAGACDTNPDHGEGWVLRSSERRYVLDTLRKRGKLHEAIEQRRAVEVDEETGDLLLALEDQGPFSDGAMAADLAAPKSEERVRRIVVALDRAGNRPDLLQTARSALAALGREARRKLIEKRGFFGRDAEKTQLDVWLNVPQLQAPIATAFLSGLPGIGKSALLEEMVRKVADQFNAVTVRLDFDRAGLDVLDVLGLTMEVARQLGERLGEAGKPLLDARLAAASQQVGEESVTISRRSSIPPELGAAIGQCVSSAGRPVTLVLDTLEVLRARGVQHPALLFGWIDQLVRYGMTPLRVISAGRGDALDTVKDRVAVPIQLDGLDDESSMQLLERLNVASRDRAGIVAIADGNPLVLRLAGEVAKRFGANELPRTKLEKEVAAAFLYRFLLSRITDPLLCKLAHPGLVTRRISAALLREVLADIVGVEPLSEQQALEAFQLLSSQHWLVTPDPVDPSFVIHRSDMRAVLLPLLYRDEPGLCAKIDRAAVTWFGKRDDPDSRRDAAYHRLQLLRQRTAKPLISSAVAVRFDDDMLRELPKAAQDIVVRARGGRTFFTGDSASSALDDDSALASELMALIDRQDWAEGQYVVDQAVERGGFDAISQTADAVRAFYWRSGKWLDARRLLSERDRLGADDSDIWKSTTPWSLGVARLEMRAVFTPDRLKNIRTWPIYDQLIGDLIKQVAPWWNGALGFRLLAGDSLTLSDGSGREANVLAAALQQWDAGISSDAAVRAKDIAREGLASRGGIVAQPEEPSVAGQLLATHSPYVVFVANLATQSGYGWLNDVAAQSARTQAEVGALFVPPLAGHLSPVSASPFADICQIGLFAEWADATGFLEGDPNLRMIGRAAERWRRTVAGNWKYGRPPRGWLQKPLDAVIEARTEAARLAPNDHALCRIDLWTRRDGTPADFTKLEGRIQGSLRRAAAQAESLDRARELLGRGVPSAFVPALVARLASHPSRFRHLTEQGS